MRGKRCPLCNARLYTQTWSEEQGIVETIEACRDLFGCNQYLEHWFYGTTKLRVGVWEAEFSGNSKEAETYCEEFKRRIPKTRRYFKRVGKWVKP